MKGFWKMRGLQGSVASVFVLVHVAAVPGSGTHAALRVFGRLQVYIQLFLKTYYKQEKS